ncbi:unnamed protein product [Cuscuta epithymum]|uniref:Integrase catalytic domain-containing protein n=1 Tax=Cuscuta epithymum TaxID=186058 RepID=A0AAV0DYY5_9ASTE|nr:unnamed protein product [Cuscuta epithymum]
MIHDLLSMNDSHDLFLTNESTMMNQTTNPLNGEPKASGEPLFRRLFRMANNSQNPSTGRGRGSAGGGHACATVHAMKTQQDGEVIVAPTSGSEDVARMPDFTDVQWRNFLQLMEKCKTTASQEKLLGMGACNNTWLLDSGASFHMTGQTSLLMNVRKIKPLPVYLPNGEVTSATSKGTVKISLGITLQNVLLVPGLMCNLISLAQLIDDRNCSVFFTNDVCVIQDLPSRTLIRAGEKHGGVYYFRSLDSARACSITEKSKGDLWHSRLGHPSVKVLRSVITLNNSTLDTGLNKSCDACFRGKKTRDIFHISESRAFAVFDLIHCDVWGPYRSPASCGARYFLTIVDDYSRAVWVFLMKEKSEVSRILKQFIMLVDRQFNKRVKIVRSDNGTEFQCLKNYFLDHGIIFQTTCVYTPQQNGRVERKHRHILNIARTLRFHAHLPIDFWGECVLTACYLINRLPSPILEYKSPYELLYNKRPNYDHLRVFGCLCYARAHGNNGDKFAQRGLKCVFLGYPYSQKGWKMYDLEGQRFFVSRDVTFVESEFPFRESIMENADSNDTSRMVTEPPHYLVGDDHDDMHAYGYDDNDGMHTGTRNSQASSSSTSAHDEGNHDDTENDTAATSFTSHSQEAGSSDTPTQPFEHSVRRGTRPKRQPVWHKDYTVQINTMKIDTPPVALLSPSVESGNPYPLSHYVNYNCFSVQHRAFIAAISASREPNTFCEAVGDPNWRVAMQHEEIDALERTGGYSGDKDGYEIPAGTDVFISDKDSSR